VQPGQQQQHVEGEETAAGQEADAGFGWQLQQLKFILQMYPCIIDGVSLTFLYVVLYVTANRQLPSGCQVEG
jgi:hypothetical protein